MQNYTFNIEFMENLLNKIKQESKRTFLADNFNVDLIKYAQKRENQGVKKSILRNCTIQ